MQRRDMLKTIALGAGALGTGLTQPTGLQALANETSRTEPSIEKNGVKFWLENSLTRVYPNSSVGSAVIPSLTTARNARLSFQACFRNLKDCSIRVRATVEGAKDLHPQVRRVGYVPLQQLNTDVPLDELDGVGHVPGLAPDPLFPDPTAHIGPAEFSSSAPWSRCAARTTWIR